MTQTKKTTILIVDDDPTFLLMLSQFLGKEGYHVIQAADGELAVAAFREFHPDCVLMDIAMPVLDGFEACRRIRLTPDGKEVTVIMVTARESDEAVDLCYESGASDYISKPIHWAVLRNRVRNLIERHHADRRIRESEHRFSQIFSSTKDAFWLIDAISNELLFVNDSFENIFCLSKDTLKLDLLAWQECVHPEERSYVENIVDQYRRGETNILEEEFRIIRPGGGINWVQVHCFPVLDFNGDVIRQVGVASDVTARKMSQDYFQVLIKSVRAVPWSLDLKSGKFTFVGEQIVDVLGISVDQLSDADAWEALIHPDDREWAVEYCRIQVAKGQAHEFEYRMLVDGEIIWVRDSVAVNLGEGGPVGISGFMFNITASKQADELIASSECKMLLSAQRYELHKSQASIGMIEWDTDLNVCSWNVGAENIFGYGADETVGRHVTELILPSLIREEVDQVWQSLIHQKGDYHSINENITQDGKTIICEWNNTPLVQGGEVVGVYSLVSDVSEREQQLHELSKMKQAIEQAGESFMITDKDGIIEYVNPAFTKITGYTAKEALGKNPRLLKSGRQPPKYYERLWKTITSGRIWHSSVIDSRKDGSQYPASMTISPIIDSDALITHYVAIQQDMTEHKELEEKFHQAQKMQALGTLVGGIAHDFNNLLAGMTGNLYLARKKVEGIPDVVKKLEQVEKLSFRASDMVKQLLTFARKGIVEMKPFALVSFMKEVSKLSEAVVPENICFKNNLCREELIIKGDATQLQQVLMNLLSNACDALVGVADAEIVLTIESFEADEQFVSSHEGLDHHLFAHLIVKDNGAGIRDENKEHIFEPFYTTKEVGMGTGLGLSMVYGAIQSHGGVLEVESQDEVGTSFHIYLPLIKEENIHIAPEYGVEPFMGNGEVILLVDDNADVRETGKEVLESLGYQVLEASDGLQAIEVFVVSQHDISLIIMDVVMPRLGGVQAIERIKDINPDVKVIFASGYDKDEGLKSEMPSDEYNMLSKPFSVTTLSHEIRKHLDH